MTYQVSTPPPAANTHVPSSSPLISISSTTTDARSDIRKGCPPPAPLYSLGYICGLRSAEWHRARIHIQQPSERAGAAALVAGEIFWPRFFEHFKVNTDVPTPPRRSPQVKREARPLPMPMRHARPGHVGLSVRTKGPTPIHPSRAL